MNDLVPYQDATPAVVASQAPAQRPGRFLAILRRRWWIPALTVTLAVSASVAYLRSQVPGYVARGQMWVRGKIRVTDMPQFAEEPASFFGTHIILMQSEAMRTRAMSRLKNQHPEFAIPTDVHGRPIPVSVRVTQSKGAAVFALECTSRNAEYAQKFLNALMDEFLAYKEEVRSATAGDLLASVSEQVYKQERNLKLEQEKLSQFQRENNLVQLDEQVRSGGNRLAQLNNQLALLELERNLMDAVALEKTLGGQVTGAAAEPPAEGGSRLNLSAGTMSAEHIAARQKLLAFKVQKEQLGRYLRPKHPKIVSLNEQIDGLERMLEFLKVENQEQLVTAREAMTIRLESLRKAIATLEGEVGDANRRYAELERIKASIDRQQKLYDQLLSLLRSIDLNKNLDQETVAILERAGRASSTEQSRLKVLLAGVFGGGIVGLGIVQLLSRQDDRCTSLDDVRAEFAEEIVGQIPEVRKVGKRRYPTLLDMNGDAPVFAESCRGLRSTLLFNQWNGQAPRVILVTSAIPAEGKSTVALNLAQALSMGGARVLLIDADLRCGQLHRLLGEPSETGLADLLVQSGDIDAFVHSTRWANLSLLARGSRTRNAGELLLGASCDQVLRQARERYAYVIVDTVPVFAADDAATLAPKVDGVLFVVRRSFTSARLAQEALQVLYQRSARIMGIVFNRADSRSRAYRYYKYDEYHSGSA